MRRVGVAVMVVLLVMVVAGMAEGRVIEKDSFWGRGWGGWGRWWGRGWGGWGGGADKGGGSSGGRVEVAREEVLLVVLVAS